jgi:hypothetical protein
MLTEAKWAMRITAFACAVIAVETGGILLSQRQVKALLEEIRGALGNSDENQNSVPAQTFAREGVRG